MKRVIWLWLSILTVALLSTCAAPKRQEMIKTVVVEKEVVKTVEVTKEVEVEKVVEKPAQTDDAAKSEPLPPVAGDIPSGAPPRANRLIIKDAEMELTVEDTDVAIDRLTQVGNHTHSEIDAHLLSTANPHSVKLSTIFQGHTLLVYGTHTTTSCPGGNAVLATPLNVTTSLGARAYTECQY